MSPVRVLGVASLVVGAAIAWSRCSNSHGDGAAEQPRVPGAVLEFDGVSISREEVERFYPYLERVDAKLGRKTRIRGILSKHVLQVALARRDHPELRNLAREAAQAIAESAGNYIELVELGQTRGIGSEPEKPVSRNSLPLEVARFAFAEENLGAVSPPLECPEGFVVVAARDIVRGASTVSDLCYAYLIWFPTHSTPEDFSTWWREARNNAHGSVTYVHPEYQEALPRWLLP